MCCRVGSSNVCTYFSWKFSHSNAHVRAFYKPKELREEMANVLFNGGGAKDKTMAAASSTADDKADAGETNASSSTSV